MEVFYNIAIVAKIASAGVMHLFDLIKDSIILFEISHSQRGIVNLMGQAKPYIKFVCISNKKCPANKHPHVIFRSSLHGWFPLLFLCYLVVCNFLKKDQKQFPIISTKVEFLKNWPWFYSCLFILSTSKFKKSCWKKQEKITLFHLIHYKNQSFTMHNSSK